MASSARRIALLAIALIMGTWKLREVADVALLPPPAAVSPAAPLSASEGSSAGGTFSSSSTSLTTGAVIASMGRSTARDKAFAVIALSIMASLLAAVSVGRLIMTSVRTEPAVTWLVTLPTGTSSALASRSPNKVPLKVAGSVAMVTANVTEPGTICH